MRNLLLAILIAIAVMASIFKHVSAVCRGKRQRHGGFHWRFEDMA